MRSESVFSELVSSCIKYGVRGQFGWSVSMLNKEVCQGVKNREGGSKCGKKYSSLVCNVPEFEPILKKLETGIFSIFRGPLNP